MKIVYQGMIGEILKTIFNNNKNFQKMKRITYKSLLIVLSKQGRDYTWKITKLDGSALDEAAESAEEFQSEEDAIDDAKEFIDGWYEAE